MTNPISNLQVTLYCSPGVGPLVSGYLLVNVQRGLLGSLQSANKPSFELMDIMQTNINAYSRYHTLGMLVSMVTLVALTALEMIGVVHGIFVGSLLLAHGAWRGFQSILLNGALLREERAYLLTNIEVRKREADPCREGL